MPNAQPEDFSKTAHHEPIPPALNQIRAVRLFMQAGGQHTDVMDIKQTGFYIGMELEELAEQLREVAAGKVTPLNPHDDIVQTINWMEMLAKQFKENAFYGDLMRADREKLLDGFIDSIVVTSGAALSYSHDAEAAFREVNRANMSKFPNGVATRDANGKIMKPAGWTGPNLTPFVRAKEDDK